MTLLSGDVQLLKLVAKIDLRRYWEANVAVHERGLELIKPGVRCR